MHYPMTGLRASVRATDFSQIIYLLHASSIYVATRLEQ